MPETEQSGPVETPDSPRHQKYTPGEPNLAQKEHQNWFRRFVKARVSKKKFAEAAVATGGAASVVGTLLGGATADRGGENTDVGAADATSENVATVDITPASTTASGETIVPGTNVAVPTISAETPKPAETPKSEEAAVSPIYGQLKTRIGSENLSGDEKTQLLGTVDKLEKTAKVLGRFERAYENAKEPDGTPTLYKVQTERFANADFTSLYPGKTKEQALQQYWTDNLKPAFLRDIANIHGIENVLGGAKTFEEFRVLLENYGKNYFNAFSADYTKFEFAPAEPRNLVIDVDADVLADPKLASRVEAEKAKLADLAAKLPNVGTIHYKIRSKLGGNYDVNNNVIEISLGNLEYPDYIKVHETGHYLDVFLNREMQGIASPELIFGAMVLREKIINSFHNDLSVDNYLSSDRIAVSQKIQKGEKLSGEELDLAVKINAERRFLADASKLLSKEAGGGDAFFGGRTTYSGWAEVVAKQGAELNRLAGQNANMKALIADIKARPEYYDGCLGDGLKQGFGFSNEIRDLATMRYVLDIYGGKVNIGNNPELKIFLVRDADQEIFADSLGTLLKFGDPDFGDTLGVQYLRLLK